MRTSCQARLPAEHDRLIWSTDAELMSTSAAGYGGDAAGIPVYRTLPPGNWTVQGHQRQVALTSTNVPRFAGVTSWEQYRQVFGAIVLSV